jgi:nucleotide-binding universal stress UspA family protein
VAFAHALKIALAAQAGLDMLHVSEQRNQSWTEFPGVRGTLERWQLLPPNSPRKAVASLGIDVRKVVMKGSDPVRAAERFLEKNPTDLVVLAAHAQQGHMRWTHTSVSQPIARAAAAATLFLPYGGEGFISQADGSSTLRNILLPVVTFTLLHVGRAEIPSVEAEEQPGWTWKKVTRDGDVVDAIVAVAGECAADLIVMTTAGRNGFLDALRGSTTERVLRSGVAPLLAIPAALM